jgi:4-hydroxy-tetrahydrodipicolinate synthase
MEANYNELFHLMFVEGNPAGVKCMLHEKGMILNRLRLPLVPVSEETHVRIKRALAKFSR